MLECDTALSLAVGGRADGLKIKEEEEEMARSVLLGADSNADGSVAKAKAGARKKLKLSTLQLASLEDAFRAHTTLAPEQKQGLAQRLDLQPRQVEVWFQNRRARTKLKQTEVDYEFLKKCCERLTSENRRLKRELMELKLTAKPQSSSSSSSNYAELRPNAKAAKLSVCSSCEKMTVISNCERKSNCK